MDWYFRESPAAKGWSACGAKCAKPTLWCWPLPSTTAGLSSVTKAVIENLEHPSALAGKPVALLGVAAGPIGAIKSLEMLRSITSHVGAIVLPQAVSVAAVQTKFSADGKVLDEATEKMVRSLATNLVTYLQDAVCPKHKLARLAEQTTAAVSLN
jgi:chromate reductase, NAD(P)H dehydrogenase (quinone)